MSEESNTDIEDILVQLEDDKLIDMLFIQKLAASPQQLAGFADKWGDGIFTSLLKSLTHKIYPPQQARALWQGIVKHREHLSAKLNRDPGIGVIALDYLTNFAEVRENLAIIEESRLSEIAGFATKDELTGLYVRKIFESVCEQQVNEAHRYGNALCLLMADIDDFKRFNDTHGHQEGDRILSEVGSIIIETIRDSDIASRYGGEELAIITPKTNLPEAFFLAERLRLAVANHFGNESITLSMGIAELNQQQSKEQLIESADKSLYEAKAQGKNRCVSAKPL